MTQNGENGPGQEGSSAALRTGEAQQGHDNNGGLFPREFTIFIADLRELFREIKKFFMFFRNKGNSSGALVAATIMLVVVGFLQLVIIALEVRPIRQSAENSARQVEMLDRPWIKVELSSASDFKPQNGSVGWAVTIKADNVGHSVATEAFPDARLIAISDADFIDSPRRQVTQLCRNMIKRSESMKATEPDLWNNSIFPGDSHTFIPFNTVLWPRDIDGRTLGGGLRLGASIFPVLIGCIEYRYPTSSKTHHTGFVYIITHNDDSDLPESSRVFFSLGKTIPRDSVILRQFGEVAD